MALVCPAKLAPVPQVRLVHAAASLLLSKGVPVPVVSEMPGHSNPSITMTIYSHALPDSQHVAASAMDALLGN